MSFATPKHTLHGRSVATTPVRAPDTVLSRLEARLVDCADEVAVCAEGEAISYRDLGRYSADLAATLQARGLGADSRIGVCLPPSARAIVAIVAVLRSGAAYVPMPTDLPATVARQIYADAGVTIVLGPAAAADAGSDPGSDSGSDGGSALLETIAVDRWPDAGEPHERWTPRAWSSRRLAYVIFTSGSSGRPKGVMVEHDNLERSLAARRECYGTAPYRALLLPSLAFDSSVAVIFPVLCQGGTLVVASRGERQDPVSMLALVERHAVSEILALPSVYEAMLDVDDAPRQLSTVARVILAGDRLPPSLVARHFDVCPAAALYNEYGPTEATVWTTVHRCTREDARGAVVPIGRPVAGASVYLLDSAMHELSSAADEGELFVGGPLVARGYCGNGAQTAERFVPDPCAGVPGARMYRTGDRMRLRPDGALEFIGRVDDQVKVRGYRIELSHVEHALRAHPQVRSAAVVLRRHAPWTNQLVAFVEPRTPVVAVKALNEFLAERLAPYMLPCAYVQVAVLPRTPNGKLDRQSLAAVGIEALVEGSQYVPPRTPLEEQLCDTWCGLLQLPKVSVLDSYLDFGADSIAAMQFTAAARRRGLAVQAMDVFKYGSVAEMAAAIADRAHDPTDGDAWPGSAGEGPFYSRPRAHEADGENADHRRTNDVSR
jgi:amino acid adenylation domain-containing protein